MNLKREKRKRKIYFVLQILFAILTFAASALYIFNIVNNAFYTVIAMIFSLVFGSLYQNSKKAVEENSNQ
ncbi:MAG: hypothetical protein HFJ09_10965 [Lachnospiraceae bacterium]|nr:hypothetical protein [Lachnospiraceae bacterium]